MCGPCIREASVYCGCSRVRLLRPGTTRLCSESHSLAHLPPNSPSQVSTHAAMEALRAAGQENFAEREQIVLSFFPEPTAQELEV